MTPQPALNRQEPQEPHLTPIIPVSVVLEAGHLHYRARPDAILCSAKCMDTTADILGNKEAPAQNVQPHLPQQQAGLREVLLPRAAHGCSPDPARLRNMVMRCACEHRPRHQHGMTIGSLCAAPLMEGHMRQHELQHLSRQVFGIDVAAGRGSRPLVHSQRACVLLLHLVVCALLVPGTLWPANRGCQGRKLLQGAFVWLKASC